MPTPRVTPRTKALFSQWQSLVDSANSLIGARIAAINDASLTDSLKWPYFALPNIFHVSSQAQMLAQYGAYEGELPGGLAIRSDTNTAHRLTGADWKQAGSWTLDSRVIVTGGVMPGATARGTVAYVSGIGWHVFDQQTGWTLITSDSFGRLFNAEMLNRIRFDAKKLVLGDFGDLERVPPAYFENNEWYWDIFSETGLNYSDRRIAFSRNALGANSGNRFANVGIVQRQPGTVSLNGQIEVQPFTIEWYASSKDRAKFRFRAQFPTPMDFIGNQPIFGQIAVNAIGASAAVGNVIVEPIGNFPVRLEDFNLPATTEFSTGSIRLRFSGAVQPGDSGFDIVMAGRGAYEFPTAAGLFLEAIDQVRHVTNVLFTLQTQSFTTTPNWPIIYPEDTGFIVQFPFETISPQFFEQKDRRALRVQTPIPDIPAGKLWYNITQTQFAYSIGGASGGAIVLAKAQLRAELNFDPTDRLGTPAGRRLILAPNQREAVSFTDPTGSVSRACEFILPRYPILKSTDSPNTRTVERPPPGSGITLQLGCVVWEIYARRKSTRKDTQPEHWNPLTMQIGVIGTAGFRALGSLTIPADTRDARIDTEWIVFQAMTLAYQCSEEVEIQARVLQPDPDVNPSNFLDYLSGGALLPPISASNKNPPLVRNLITDVQYNDTAKLLQRLETA